MLFYNQIKKVFNNVSWKTGQVFYREERVKNVRLDGNHVACRVKDSDDNFYDTAIEMARGTIFKSQCSCGSHSTVSAAQHCSHVAALSIWVVERGSLLRAGIGDGDNDDEDDSVTESEDFLVLVDYDRAKLDIKLHKILISHPIVTSSAFKIRRDKESGLIFGKASAGKAFSIPVSVGEALALEKYSKKQKEVQIQNVPVRAEPITFVRGLFQSKVFSGLSLEAGAKYIDPKTKEVCVEPLNHMVRLAEERTWKNSKGLHLKLTQEFIPIVENVNNAKIIYQGHGALDQLAKLLVNTYRKQMHFHDNVKVELSPETLKLESVEVGARTAQKSRLMTYVFRNSELRLDSQEMTELSAQGRLSNFHVWKDGILYKLEPSLSRISRFANRSGVDESEDAGQALKSPDGFSLLHDDDAHPLHPVAAYRLSLELGVKQFVVDSSWKEFHEWKKNFDRKKSIPLPKVEFGFDLRDYQQNGLSWIWSLFHRGLSALLADDMGLGKTHQVLAFLSSIYRVKNRPKEPTLVIAPTSVVSAWAQKMQKYETGLSWQIFHGRDRDLDKVHDDGRKADLILTTYGILQKEEVLRNRTWHCVVLDEAQSIKNSSTISSRAARALKAKFKIALTGTPVENNSTDLWSVMEFLLPGYLGSLARFKRLYGSGREAPSREQAQSLKRLINPFLLRRTKSQVLKELPEKTEELVSCEMSAVQKKRYRAFLNGEEATKVRENLQGAGKIDYASVLSLLTRLKQICDHPKLIEYTTGKIKKIKNLDPIESGKWETFDELLNEALGSNLKVVVFSQYLGILDLISHVLEQRGIGHTELRGDTPDRAKRLKVFAEDPECKVFLCSLLAGGLGIDLTSASVCIHFDRWWNPAKENQATDRLHRFGQTRGVQVFKLQIPGTIEDRIANIIESKKELSGALIEESPVGLKAFSRKELLTLLSDPWL